MDIESQLKKGISDINVAIEKEQIDQEAGIMSSGLLDSFGFIEFVTFIEDEFKISIDEEELTTENFLNINCTTKFIKRKLG